MTEEKNARYHDVWPVSLALYAWCMAVVLYVCIAPLQSAVDQMCSWLLRPAGRLLSLISATGREDSATTTANAPTMTALLVGVIGLYLGYNKKLRTSIGRIALSVALLAIAYEVAVRKSMFFGMALLLTWILFARKLIPDAKRNWWSVLVVIAVGASLIVTLGSRRFLNFFGQFFENDATTWLYDIRMRILIVTILVFLGRVVVTAIRRMRSIPIPAAMFSTPAPNALLAIVRFLELCIRIALDRLPHFGRLAREVFWAEARRVRDWILWERPLSVLLATVIVLAGLQWLPVSKEILRAFLLMDNGLFSWISFGYSVGLAVIAFFAVVATGFCRVLLRPTTGSVEDTANDLVHLTAAALVAVMLAGLSAWGVNAVQHTVVIAGFTTTPLVSVLTLFGIFLCAIYYWWRDRI